MSFIQPGKTEWMLILNPGLPERLGRIRHVLCDFDGTFSLLREGWEGVMIPMMLEMICPSRPAPPEIEQEVRQYVDQSTGVLTIRQMEWLAHAVHRHGWAQQALAPAEYKTIYVRRILERVAIRVAGLEKGSLNREACLVAGSRAFLQGLARRGAALYLASGTDHPDVLNEAHILEIDAYFDGRIYGALDASESHDKELIIRRILAENDLPGDELLVVGDGPVEMRVAAAQGAIALGVACDEVAGSGWNNHKIQRLARAGAHVIVPDFIHVENLISFLFPEE